MHFWYHLRALCCVSINAVAPALWLLKGEAFLEVTSSTAHTGAYYDQISLIQLEAISVSTNLLTAINSSFAFSSTAFHSQINNTGKLEVC